MKQAVRVSDFYMPMLARLSDDDKLDIISKLVVTIRSKSTVEKAKPDLRTCFSGNWENEKTTTQVADELRAARHYEQKDLVW